VRLFLRTSAAISVALIVGGGCGHLAFDELPLADSDAGVDGGADGIDAALPDVGADDTGRSDAGDAAVDGGCAGPACVGTFVSGNTGSDSNPGTATLPVATITKGIAIAVGLGGKQSVYVAAAHYTEKVTLAEAVDLLGGYDCNKVTCPWNRDVVLNDTAIMNQDFEGVLAPKTVTRRTLFDGFRVVGKAGTPVFAPGSAAILLDGATPTITRCGIFGGDMSGGGNPSSRRSIGVAVLGPSNDPAGALIDRNKIVAGDSTDTSFGVLLDSKTGGSATGPAVAVLTGNAIHGGNAPSTSGVAAFSSGAATLLQGNDITAGTSNGNGNGSSWGITVASAMTIDGNRINADQTTVGTCTSNGSFCGGIQSLSSTTIITNNVVLGVKGPRTCAVLLTEAEQAAGIVVLNANTLDGAGSNGVSSTVSTAIAVRIGNCGACGTNAVIGKARNNILLGGTNLNRYGVYEEGFSGKTSHLSALDNNDFWNAPAALPRNDFAYRLWAGDGGAGQDLTFAQLATLTTPVPNADFNVDPLLDATYHLTAASTCADKGTATEAPARDIDGELRPKGIAVDVGADESR
jgi:hypothetical protein